MTTLPQPASTIVPATPGTTVIGFWDSDTPELYAAPYTVLASGGPVRGTVLPPAPSRVNSPPALLRRTRALYLAACRFSLYRARTPDAHRFANALCDGLAGTLAAVDPAAPRQELRHDA